MPKVTYTVETHPDKKKIQQDLLKQVPYRAIAEKYKISKTALARYCKEKFAPKIAAAVARTDERDQNYLVKEIDRIMARGWKYADAVDEELRDPDDPDKYFFGPQAKEIEVSYLYKDPKDNSEARPRKGKASLQELLDRVEEHGYPATYIDIKTADPRVMHIRNTEALVKTLDSLAKIVGQVKELTVNVTHTEEWTIIKQIILQASEESPQTRDNIIAAFKKLNY